MRWILTIMLVLMQAIPAAAQDDKDRITRYIEEALSDQGREVRIEGFRGALNSRATLEKLTIADETGIWLTLTDAVLDWNRAALLRGRIEINEMSAARIDLPRLPASGGGTPSPEAGTFALPELPVSVSIGKVSVKRVDLGAPVIGIPSSVEITGAMSLAGGQGAAKLAITRLDGPSGAFRLDASFVNETRILAIDLSLVEAAGGITATVLKLPGGPPLDLSVRGNSVIDDFTADVILKSDGQERLAGRISTRQIPVSESASTTDAPTRVIHTDIAGDLAPLFVPEYGAFFGPDVALKSRISFYSDGRASLDTLTVTSAALRLTGNLLLSASRLPERFNLDAVLQGSGGDPVLLPLSGPKTRVQRATLSASFDSSLGDAWSLTGDLQGLERENITLDRVQFTANGMIQGGETREVTARIDGAALGIDLPDPALATAIGTALTLGADIRWRDGQPLEVSDLELGAEGLVLSGAGIVRGLNSAATVEGAARVRVSSLSRFSALAGRPLMGGLEAEISGTAALMTGAFDLALTAVATDLGLGIPDIDAALAGESQLSLSALRNTEGLTLRAANVRAKGGTIEASGQISTGESDMHFKAALVDTGQFIDGLDGPANLTGRAVEDAAGWTIDLNAKAPRAIALTSQIALPQGGPAHAQIDANIGSVAWIIPDLAGPTHIRGSIRETGPQWAIDAQAEGPGNSTLAMDGQIARDAKTAALGLKGSLPLALLNRRLKPRSAQGLVQFDLKLDGPLALSSLSGQLRTSGARLSLPALRNALTGIDATVTLAGRSAEITATSDVSTGGTLSAEGRIGMQAPFATNIAVQVTNVKITDPKLYKTKVNGALTLTGSAPAKLLLAGRLVLGKTEIVVPSTGISTLGEIPPISHLNEPAGVHQTRAFAGLLDAGAAEAAGSGAVGLDVQVIAENRIFVRGRGLDAELGGKLSLTGTTNDIIPLGRFELIRGRLDILGKRLNLEEGYINLQGDMIPTLRLVARTTSDDAVLYVIVEGRADAPEISFESDPDLPDDEVLARLLFGRDIATISPLQAAQLASAVATLAGRGGKGIVERLRQTTGFDDLDLASDGEGGSSVSVGKYINKNIYTNVEVDSDGQSRINLNLDLTRTTKLRGKTGTDGNSGIGLFFERDY